jgi:hypothetical protein
MHAIMSKSYDLEKGLESQDSSALTDDGTLSGNEKYAAEKRPMTAGQETEEQSEFGGDGGDDIEEEKRRNDDDEDEDAEDDDDDKRPSERVGDQTVVDAIAVAEDPRPARVSKKSMFLKLGSPENSHIASSLSMTTTVPDGSSVILEEKKKKKNIFFLSFSLSLSLSLWF